MSSLGDEYKILQDKIDKIGAFRTTIKGWSVTATVAVLVAVTSDKGFSTMFSAIALDVLLVSFFWFEREQVRIGWLFNGRARSIEIQIDKRRRQRSGKAVLFSSPNIARSLFGAKKRRELFSRPYSDRRIETWRRRVNDQARLARSSDVAFYLILGLAAWGPKWFGKPSPSNSTPVVVHDYIQVPNPTVHVEVAPPLTSVPHSAVRRTGGRQ